MADGVRPFLDIIADIRRARATIQAVAREERQAAMSAGELALRKERLTRELSIFERELRHAIDTDTAPAPDSTPQQGAAS